MDTLILVVLVVYLSLIVLFRTSAFSVGVVATPLLVCKELIFFTRLECLISIQIS